MWTTAGLYKVDHAFLSPVLQYCLENPSSFFMSLFECLLLHELAWMSHEFPISPQNYDFCLSHDLTIEQLWFLTCVSSSGWRQAPRGHGVGLSSPSWLAGGTHRWEMFSGWEENRIVLLAAAASLLAVAAQVNYRGAWALHFGHKRLLPDRSSHKLFWGKILKAILAFHSLKSNTSP